MPSVFRLCVLACVSLGVALPASADPAPRKPQAVIISFDGAHDLAQWQRSRTLAARTGARFTYFLSCVFLLSKETRCQYEAPGKGPGKSNVGFAQSREEVAARLMQIRQARSEGHEIASHGCGHFDGRNWSKADWLDEFESFSTILRDAYVINGIPGEPAGWRNFAETGVSGFRAPYLSTSKTLYSALAEAKFAYDASGVSRGPAEPEAAGGVTRFALPQISEGPASRRVIAMDYNLFVRHSGGLERPDEASVFEARALEAFRAAFDAQYAGDRIPLQIGFHFTLMNGGAYWRALERFAEQVCVKQDVECLSYEAWLTKNTANAAKAKADPGLGG
jgi:peptidoglycan/xylan/chitin deacetylase (PgdA/CDA1 family)